MNENTKPYAFLLFGVPMSGKTWFGTKFSDQFKATFLNLNDLSELHAISRASINALVLGIAKSQQTFLLEGATNTEKHRQELKKLLLKAGYQPVLVWIQTDVATIRHRLKSKHQSIDKAKAIFEEHINRLEAPADNETPIVISGKHTFATQLKTVLANLSRK